MVPTANVRVFDWVRVEAQLCKCYCQNSTTIRIVLLLGTPPESREQTGEKPANRRKAARKPTASWQLS